MGEQEAKASQPETTEEELGRAAEALEIEDSKETAIEETVGEETVVGETPDKVKDEVNALNSGLGRKVKFMESQMAAQQARNDEILAKLDSMSRPTSPEEGLDDDTYMTKAQVAQQVAQFVAEEKKKATDQDTKYREEYSIALASQGSELSEAEHNANVAEHFANPDLNVRLSNDPKRDAETNYLKANNVVLRKKSATKVNPLQGDPPTGPLGVGGGSKVESKAEVMPNLDPAVKAFVDSHGKDAAWVNDALKQK